MVIWVFIKYKTHAIPFESITISFYEFLVWNAWKIKQTGHYDVTDSLNIHEGLICTSISLVHTFSSLKSEWFVLNCTDTKGKTLSFGIVTCCNRWIWMICMFDFRKNTHFAWSKFQSNLKLFDAFITELYLHHTYIPVCA